MVRLGQVTVLWVLAATPAWAAQDDPPRFDDFTFIQFIESSRLSPRSIVKLDNNGALLLAARKGVTRDQMRAAGLPVLESQIALLETWRLLDERDDTLTARFPILFRHETETLREATRGAATALTGRLTPHVRALLRQLNDVGREDNAYAILFSYVLDGLVWDEFEARGLIAPRGLTVEAPLWSGEVWALYPPRPTAPGTNTISDQGVALKVMWTEEIIPVMRPFVADIPTLATLFDEYRTLGRIENARARKVFAPFDLFDETGRLTVPVIVEDPSDSLYHLARQIAQAIAADAPGALNLPRLASTLSLRDEQRALVVAYHELMWDILDRLDTEGIVRKPLAVRQPARARPADIAALVFVVRAPTSAK